MITESSKIVVYTTPLCGYCSAAKRLLAAKRVEYEEIGVFSDAGKRGEMIERTGRRTVPQIFIGDTHVGGFDDLNTLEQRGDLDRLLERVFEPAEPEGE